MHPTRPSPFSQTVPYSTGSWFTSSFRKPGISPTSNPSPFCSDDSASSVGVPPSSSWRFPDQREQQNPTPQSDYYANACYSDTQTNGIATTRSNLFEQPIEVSASQNPYHEHQSLVGQRQYAHTGQPHVSTTFRLVQAMDPPSAYEERGISIWDAGQPVTLVPQPSSENTWPTSRVAQVTAPSAQTLDQALPGRSLSHLPPGYYGDFVWYPAPAVLRPTYAEGPYGLSANPHMRPSEPFPPHNHYSTVPSFSNQFDPSFSFSTHGMGDRIVVENLGFPARVSVKGIPSPPTSSSSRRPHGQQTLATAGVTMGIANIRRTSGTNEGTAIDATFRSLGVSRPPNLEATAASRVGATGTPQCSSEDTKRVVGTSAGRRAGIERRKGKAKFFCDFEGCPSSFTRRHNYDFHLKSHQGITVTCGRCYKTLAASSLKRHEKTCKGSREELQASSDAMK